MAQTLVDDDDEWRVMVAVCLVEDPMADQSVLAAMARPPTEDRLRDTNTVRRRRAASVRQVDSGGSKEVEASNEA